MVASYLSPFPLPASSHDLCRLQALSIRKTFGPEPCSSKSTTKSSLAIAALPLCPPPPADRALRGSIACKTLQVNLSLDSSN